MGNRRKSTASIGAPRKRGAPSRRPSLPQLIQRMSTRESAKRAAHAGRLKDALARLRVELQSLENDITAVQVRHRQNGDRAALGVDDAPMPTVLRDIVNVSAPKSHTPLQDQQQQTASGSSLPIPTREFVPISTRSRIETPSTAAAAVKDASSYESVLRAHNRSTQLRAYMHNAADALAPQTPPRVHANPHIASGNPIISTNNALANASTALANSRLTSAAVASCLSTPTLQRRVPATPHSTFSTPGVQPSSLPITPLKTISITSSPSTAIASCLSTPRTPVTPHTVYSAPILNLSAVLQDSPQPNTVAHTLPLLSATQQMRLPASNQSSSLAAATPSQFVNNESVELSNGTNPAPPPPPACTAAATHRGTPNTQIHTPTTFTSLTEYRDQ